MWFMLRPVLLAVVNTSGMKTIQSAGETTKFGVTLLQSHQKWKYLHITANVPMICLVVQIAENFLLVLIFFLFLHTTDNWDCRQCVSFVQQHCFWAMHRTVYEQLPFWWTVFNVPSCNQNLDILTRTEFTLLYEELLKIFLARAKCCHFHILIKHVPLLKSQKTTVLFILWQF